MRGRLQANVDFAQAGYDATVANYRRVVLTAMQEVEDGITGLASLERAPRRRARGRQRAPRAGDRDRPLRRRRVGLPRRHHRPAGAARTERLAAQLRGQRLLTSVFLVKALGGDWQGPG